MIDSTGDGVGSIQALFGCYLAPFTIFFTTAFFSLLNGDARFVFNYRASWKLPEKEANIETVVDEKTLQE